MIANESYFIQYLILCMTHFFTIANQIISLPVYLRMLELTLQK